jgi:hypothetical protein
MRPDGLQLCVERWGDSGAYGFGRRERRAPGSRAAKMQPTWIAQKHIFNPPSWGRHNDDQAPWPDQLSLHSLTMLLPSSCSTFPALG